MELEESVYSVSEGDSIKQVCAVVNTSRPESPVGFNFNVTVSLDGADGGILIVVNPRCSCTRVSVLGSVFCVCVSLSVYSCFKPATNDTHWFMLGFCWIYL